MKVKQLAIKKKNALGLLFFFGGILFKGIGDAIVVKDDPQGPFNYIKYILIVLATGAFYLQNRGKKTLFRKQFKSLMVCYFGIALISLWFSMISGKFVFRTVKEFIFALVPIVFVYFAINALNFDEVELMAKVSAIIYIVSYFIEIGNNFSISVALQAISNFSLAGGQASWQYDALESSAFPDPMMALFCFFSYYKRNNKKWQIATYIGVLLMNKRLMVLVSTIILILDYLPVAKKQIRRSINNKYIYLVPAVIFTVMPIFVVYLTQPSTELSIYNATGIDMQDFWMGRDGMVQDLLSQGFKSYGLGSTFDFRGSLLEIESVKFYLETTIIGWALISFSYWKITRGHIFSMLVMLYIFLNMNTSTSIMTGAFAWIYYLFLVGEIDADERASERYSTSL